MIYLSMFLLLSIICIAILTLKKLSELILLLDDYEKRFLSKNTKD